MIRFPRRSGSSLILCILICVFPFGYLFYWRYFDFGQTLESESNDFSRSKSQNEISKEAAVDVGNSLVDDYELSKLLLPSTNREGSAVESGNLSYDQIRRGLASVGGSTNLSNTVGGIRFDAEGLSSADVLVFLHIQKTGGTTFERYLVRQLAVPRPCECRVGRKRCYCRRPGNGLWLFSRFSNGWPCGLHADYTELVASGCVERVLNHEEAKKRQSLTTKLSKKSRRYFLTTFLREPISRFYSEYRHVTQRGATWSASLHVCNGRRATNDELPPCYDAQTGWVGATLKEFIGCEWNLAANRQTRMLADLTLVNCYNRSGMPPELRESTMLRSAIVNLKRMAYFGLQEDMRRSQYIFERTFGLEFKKPLLNWNETSDVGELTPEQLENMRRVNRLDIELYKYAKKLFNERFDELKRDDPLYDVNMAT